MSLVKPDGEKAEPVGKSRISDAELLRLRDREFYICSLQGWPYSRIARKYRVTKQLVGYRIKHVLPDAEKARLRRSNLGQRVG